MKRECSHIAPINRTEDINGERHLVFKCELCNKEFKQKLTEIAGDSKEEKDDYGDIKLALEVLKRVLIEREMSIGFNFETESLMFFETVPHLTGGKMKGFECSLKSLVSEDDSETWKQDFFKNK